MIGIRRYGLVLVVVSVLSCIPSGDKYLGTWKGTLQGMEVTLNVTKLGDSYRVELASGHFADVHTAKYENGSLIMGTDALVLSNGTIMLQGAAFTKQ